jgi:hypothetical protein
LNFPAFSSPQSLSQRERDWVGGLEPWRTQTMNTLKKLLHTWLCLALLLGLVSQAIQPAQAAGPAKPEQNILTTQGPAPVSSATTDLVASDVGAETTNAALTSAYVRDLDLGNGQRMALVSSAPVNYQAEDGSWQPIDARFQAIPGGFSNRANLLKITAAEGRAALGLESAGRRLAWVSQALVWIGPDGQEVDLALPRDPAQAAPATLSDDGQSLRYDASWSLAGLSEVIAAGPGSVEESLILASRPALPAGATAAQPGFYQRNEATLALRAVLRLPEGAALFANRATQRGAFSTTGEVQVRDAQGQNLLALAPPSAFEQANPAERVAASYRLTPLDASTWQVEVRTPWNWWQAAGRQYPAVLDPTMYMFYYVYPRGVNKLNYDYLPNETCSYYPNPFGEIANGYPVGVASTCPGNAFRLLIFFQDFPTLPHGAQLSGAQLLVAPTYADDYPYYETLGWSSTLETVRVRHVTSPWDYENVHWGDYQVDEEASDVEYLWVAPPSERDPDAPYYMSAFDLKLAKVNDWLNGVNNYGVELSLVDEDCVVNARCNTMFRIPGFPAWATEDKEKIPASKSKGGGFMLALTYTPPTLTEGAPIDSDLPSYNPPGAAVDTYGFSGHSYYLPDGPGHWEAAAVKGLVFESRAGDIRVLRSAGNPLITSGAQRSGGVFSDQSNYILSPGGATVAVEPFDLENSSRDPTFYRIEADSAQPFKEGTIFEAGTVLSETVAFSSTEILRLYDLNLVGGTQVSIVTDFSPPGTNVRLFPPSVGSTARPKSTFSAQSAPILNKKIGTTSAGIWGLAVEWPKDVSCGTESGSPNCPPTARPAGEAGAAAPLGDNPPFTITGTITVAACAQGDIFTGSACRHVDKITIGTPCETVGNYSVYSPLGEFTPDGSELLTAGDLAYIGPGGCPATADRLAVVTGGPVRVSALAVIYDSASTYEAVVSLAKWGAGLRAEAIFSLWQGGFLGYPTDPDLNGWLIPLIVDPINLPLNNPDRVNLDMKIDLENQSAEYTTILHRAVAALEATDPNGQQEYSFDLAWSVQAEGYSTTAYSHEVTYQSGLAQAELGTLEVLIDNTHWQIDFAPGSPGQFTNLRTDAKLILPAELGAAWKPAQVVIQIDRTRLDADGQPTDDYCPAANCFDVRHPTNDRAGVIDRSWDFPDIEIKGQAKTIIFNRPGEMNVFSSDHPYGPEDVSVPFSFRTFGGEVTVSRGACPSDPNGPVVTLFHLTGGMMSLPGLGSDTNQGPQVNAEFKLCGDTLDGLTMNINGLPPIPVGSTGLFITGLGAELKRVSPGGDVSITLNVNYAAEATGSLTDGVASVTIDTRGLFEIQVADGHLIKGLITYGGHARVTWDPLDFEVGVEARMHVWIVDIVAQTSGHIWQGQGWQGQYSWLPPNDEMHLTASLSAEFTIPDGELIDAGFVSLPDGDWKLASFSLQFGQFHCDCGSGYEWGIQATVDHPVYTLGIDVGLYVGFTTGPDIVLGSSDNKLIDQPALALLAQNDPALLPQTLQFAPATVYVGGQPVEVQRAVYPGPGAPLADAPFTVPENASGLMVSLGWDKLSDSPTLALIRPDGVEITPANVDAYGGEYSYRPNERSGPNVPPRRMLSLPDPMAGNWIARVDNATTATGWHLGYAINQTAPDLNITAPSAPNQAWEQDTPYPITWEVHPSVTNPESLAVNLYYTTTLAEGGERSGPVAQDIPYADGHYDWDMSYLPVGVYTITGELVYASQDGYPMHYEAGQTGQWLLPKERSLSGGTIVLSDSGAPALVAGVNVVKLDEALMVCWDPNAEHDLEGYILRWHAPDVNGDQQAHRLNVRADVAYPPVPAWKQQCARIGGVNAGDTVNYISVAAYDLNGQIGAASAAISGVVVEADQPDAAPDPGTLSVGYDPLTHDIRLTWTGAADPGKVAGYLVYYAVDKAAGPGQSGIGEHGGPSPVDVGNVTQYLVRDLPAGHRGHFVVQAYDADRRLGPISDSVSNWVTNGVDDNGNGVPDDWETAWGLEADDPDPDKDGLPNYGLPHNEYEMGTNPLDLDTDYDRYSDGEEVEAGTDPLDPGDYPALEIWPRLVLDRNFLHFNAGTEGAPPPDRLVGFHNSGGGALTLTVSSDADWLTAVIVDGAIRVQVNPAGMVCGEYLAHLTVAAAEGAHINNAPQTITVALLVYDGLLYPWMLFFPLAQKH